MEIGHGTALSVSCGAAGTETTLIVVNYADHRSQCRLRLPLGELAGRAVTLRDLMGSDVYERDRDEILAEGLYLDLPAWGYHVFQCSASV